MTSSLSDSPSLDAEPSSRRGPRYAVALLALACIGFALLHLTRSRDGIDVAPFLVDGTPVTVFRPAQHANAPVIVIAHGFAGSQQLMQPFALTLARDGYIAVTFDFPGHGRNAQPLPGGLADVAAMQRALQLALARVAAFAQALPGSDGHLALLGHSMAAEVVARYASEHDVASTVAVSLFLPADETLRPRNLLIIDGALEPAMLRDQAFAIAGATLGVRPEPGVTYGDFTDGSARRIALSPHVEHIGVLYSATSLAEARDWFDRSFDRGGAGFVDARGPWLGLLFCGIVALGWPLSALLPRVSRARGSVPAHRARTLLACTGAAAIATPLVLWRLPTSFLPILVGDYLLCHLAVFGIVMALVGAALRPREDRVRAPHDRIAPALIATLAVTAYALVAVGAALDRYVVSVWPDARRAVLVGAMLLGTLPYFLADEWVTRRLAPIRGAYAATKLALVVSLGIAIALNPERLFFLVIIVPAIVVLFVAYGLFSAWTNRATGTPWIAAIANAIVFAWFIAATFPVIAS